MLNLLTAAGFATAVALKPMYEPARPAQPIRLASKLQPAEQIEQQRTIKSKHGLADVVEEVGGFLADTFPDDRQPASELQNIDPSQLKASIILTQSELVTAEAAGVPEQKLAPIRASLQHLQQVQEAQEEAVAQMLRDAPRSLLSLRLVGIQQENKALANLFAENPTDPQLLLDYRFGYITGEALEFFNEKVDGQLAKDAYGASSGDQYLIDGYDGFDDADDADGSDGYAVSPSQSMADSYGIDQMAYDDYEYYENVAEVDYQSIPPSQLWATIFLTEREVEKAKAAGATDSDLATIKHALDALLDAQAAQKAAEKEMLLSVDLGLLESRTENYKFTILPLREAAEQNPFDSQLALDLQLAELDIQALEFFGDAVIAAINSKYLLEYYPNSAAALSSE